MNYLLNEISIQDKYAKETQLGKNKLSFDVFEKLCNLDPTTRPNKVGRYANWLLANYQANTDWGQLHAALERFIDGVKRGILPRYNISNDINSFKSYDDFISVINTLSQSSDIGLSSSEYNNRKKYKGQYELIGSTSTFDIIKILTWQAERYFGGTTDWCTVANEFTFNGYTEKGPLYIIYPKDGDTSNMLIVMILCFQTPNRVLYPLWGIIKCQLN